MTEQQPQVGLFQPEELEDYWITIQAAIQRLAEMGPPGLSKESAIHYIAQAVLYKVARYSDYLEEEEVDAGDAAALSAGRRWGNYEVIDKALGDYIRRWVQEQGRYKNENWSEDDL